MFFLLLAFQNRFSTIFEVFVTHFFFFFALHSLHCPENSSKSSKLFPQRDVKLNAKFDVDLLLDSLSHVECNGHVVHMLSQPHLAPPTDSEVIIVHSCAFQSSWLPGDIDVAQTILVILTMA